MLSKIACSAAVLSPAGSGGDVLPGVVVVVVGEVLVGVVLVGVVLVDVGVVDVGVVDGVVVVAAGMTVTLSSERVRVQKKVWYGFVYVTATVCDPAAIVSGV